MGLVIKTTGIEDYLDGGEAYIKALIMGPPSAGKTRSASFWPKPIFADCEKGRMSIADRKMPYGEIVTTKDMDDLLLKCKQECMKPVASRQYQTLVIDTLDAYQRIVIQERLQAEKKEALSGWADWGYLDAKMSAFVSKLLALPMNIVVNVHTKDTKDGDDGPMITGVKLKGDLREQIAAEFDLVGLMGTFWEAEGGERVLKRAIRWHPEPTSPILKDRSGRLPRFTPVTFTEDDYGQLFAPLIAALDELDAATTVEELPRDEEATPAPPMQGGPVAVKPEAAPKKAAKAPAKAAPAKATAPAAAVPAAAKPVIEGGAEPAPGTEKIADGTVDVATGVVTPDVAETSAEDAAAAPSEEPMTPEEVAAALGGTVASEDEPVDTTPAEEPAQPEPAAEERVVPTCGTPGQMADGTLNENPVSGCGKTLADENRDLVNIAFIKTRTYLCGACFQAYKATTAK